MSQSAKPSSPQGPSQRNRRRGWARPASESALGEAAPAFARAGFPDATLLLRWSEIAGPKVARIARPMKWQDGPSGAVLTLKCEPGAAVLLQHQTRTLIERVNAYLGAGRIARVRLVPGQLSDVPEPPPHPAPQVDLSLQIPPLSEALDRLARLRTRLKSRRPKRPD
jgi:hypothetical protein